MISSGHRSTVLEDPQLACLANNGFVARSCFKDNQVAALAHGHTMLIFDTYRTPDDFFISFCYLFAWCFIGEGYHRTIKSINVERKS